jgi:LPS sulfotransferase NodH
MQLVSKKLRGKVDASILRLPGLRPLCRSPFVIVTYARTGSTYLTDRLDSHPEITCGGELFHQSSLRHPALLKPVPVWWSTPELCHQNPLRVFSTIYRLPSKTPAVGFKLMKNHNVRIYEMLLCRPEIKVILLCRRNLFRQYLSNLLSLQSKIFNTGNPEVLQAHRQNTSRGVRMEPEAYRSWVESRLRSIARSRREFAENNLNWIELAYEDITGPDQLQGFKRITDLLQVQPFSTLDDSNLSRMNPEPAHELIRNFEEIASIFRGTPDEWMLES